MRLGEKCANTALPVKTFGKVKVTTYNDKVPNVFKKKTKYHSYTIVKVKGAIYLPPLQMSAADSWPVGSKI